MRHKKPNKRGRMRVKDFLKNKKISLLYYGNSGLPISFLEYSQLSSAVGLCATPLDGPSFCYSLCLIGTQFLGFPWCDFFLVFRAVSCCSVLECSLF